MNHRIRKLQAALVIVASMALTHRVLSDERKIDSPPRSGDQANTAPQQETTPGVPLHVARDRAKLLQDVYLSTLDVIHRRYFHGDRAMVPARAMQDIFSDMERQYQAEAEWIAVSLRPMSIDHEPDTTFEREAAKRLRKGEREVEKVDSGYYRRAVAIPLTGGCAGCHDGFGRQSTRKPFAGLVISTERMKLAATPMATVTPIARSTGSVEMASSPKTMKVDNEQTSTACRVLRCSAGSSAARSKNSA